MSFVHVVNTCGHKSSGRSPYVNNIELIGTWRDSLVCADNMRFVFPVGEIVIAKDTMLIKNGVVGGRGIIQLLTWEIQGDSIHATEIEVLGLGLNIGLATYHYKHRRAQVAIPLCRFQDRCKSEALALSNCIVHIKRSNEKDVTMNFDEELLKWKKSPSFNTDYY